MVREIITAHQEKYIIHIPQEYIDKKIEILILPFDNQEQNIKPDSKSDIFKKTAGILSTKNIDPIKWQNEIRNEWNR
jgi:hypothetical protein